MAERFFKAAILTWFFAATGCSGGGATGSPPAIAVPPELPAGAASATVPIANGATATLPSSGGYQGSVLFPASGVPAGETVTLIGEPATASAAPTSLGSTAAAGARIVPGYAVVFRFSQSLTLTIPPAFSFVLAPGMTNTGQSFTGAGYDVTDPNDVRTLFVTDSTLTTTQQSVAFPTIDDLPSPQVYATGRTYEFAIYSTGAPSFP